MTRRNKRECLDVAEAFAEIVEGLLNKTIGYQEALDLAKAAAKQLRSLRRRYR